MKFIFKATPALFAGARQDLARPHPFAHERVGFVIAGCARAADGTVVVTARDYQAVDDEDYIRNPKVGAMIGSGAMRKGLQLAYTTRSGLFHIHSHGGRGTPEFSGVDLKDAQNFVPSFFNVVPYMPHGLIVLSNDSARGRVWAAAKKKPTYVHRFISVGSPFVRYGEVA
jgi:hypothetical protein